MINSTTIGVLASIFIATLIRSSFGFGEALVAVPLLSFFLPVREAVPLATLLSITVASVVVLQDRDKIHLQSALLLIIASLFGIPIGLFLLTRVPEHTTKLILGFIIISFSLFCLISRNKFHLKSDRLAGFFGFAAGVLGGMYGMNGPPLVIYGAFRGWSPKHFRATLQGYFLPSSMIGLFGFWMAGLWVPHVTFFYLTSLPITLTAIFLGRMINHRLSGHVFTIYIHLTLITIALLLLFQSYPSEHIH